MMDTDGEHVGCEHVSFGDYKDECVVLNQENGEEGARRRAGWRKQYFDSETVEEHKEQRVASIKTKART